MRVIYIKKKTLVNIFFIIMFVAVSLIYTRVIREGTIGVFLNNEKEMPIYCVDIPDKKVALTFDTAWGEQYIQEITATLKRYDIKSTFFIAGAWADKYPELVREISSEGHEIGNHSNTHVKMTGLSRNKMASEIKETELKIKKLTGKNTRLFRAPFGEYNSTLVTMASNINYKSIHWDVDSLDWKGIGEQNIIDRVTAKIESGSIVLFHSNTADTPKALQRLIEILRKEGYKPVTVSELLFKENYYIDNTGRQRSLK